MMVFQALRKVLIILKIIFDTFFLFCRATIREWYSKSRYKSAEALGSSFISVVRGKIDELMDELTVR